MNWMQLLMSCAGRIDRRTFLIGLIPVLLLLGLVYVYGAYLVGTLPGLDWLIMAAIGLEALFFLTCLARKRLRDIGRPPWFLLFFYAPLLVAALFLAQMKFLPLQSHQLSAVLYSSAIVLALVGFFWILVELLFRRSGPIA